MKICSYCGNQISDDAKFCFNCGKPCQMENLSNIYAIKIAIEILITITCAFTIIPIVYAIITNNALVGMISLFSLFLTLPMTFEIYINFKNNIKLSIAFKILTLIFFNFIAGILMLSSKDI